MNVAMISPFASTAFAESAILTGSAGMLAPVTNQIVEVPALITIARAVIQTLIVRTSSGLFVPTINVEIA